MRIPVLCLLIATSSAAQSVTFQDGVGAVPAYAGTRDLRLYSGNSVYWSPSTNYGSAGDLHLRGGSLKNGVLIRWDVSILTPTTQVYSATAYFTVNDPSSGSYEVYESLRAWVEGQATWDAWKTGSSWATAGAEGAADRGTTALGTVTGSGIASVPFNAAGLTLVKAWVAGTKPNNGLVIRDYASGSSQLGFYSSEEGVNTRRPRLRVVFDGGTIDFQQGISPSTTYLGCTDTTIGSGSNPQNANYNAGGLVISGFNNTTLIAFDLSSLAAQSAPSTVSFQATAFDGVGGLDLYEALPVWSETSADWLRSDSTLTWQAPGARGAMDRGSALLGRLEIGGMGPFETSLFDAGVELVGQWISGARPNNGFVLLVADGGFTYFALRDREYGDAGARPALILGFSDGGLELSDGGEGARQPDYRVGCSCAGAAGPPFILGVWALLLARARRATRRRGSS